MNVNLSRPAVESFDECVKFTPTQYLVDNELKAFGTAAIVRKCESVETDLQDYKNSLKRASPENGLTNAPKVEYKGKIGLNSTQASNHDDRTLVARQMENETSGVFFALQDCVGRPPANSIWYRCPKKWTPDMVEYYTKIDESKACCDYERESTERLDSSTYDSNPYDCYSESINCSNGSRLDVPKTEFSYCPRCSHSVAENRCRLNCEKVCIMCGTGGHEVRDCNRKLCFSCGAWQKEFTNKCARCLLMSDIWCDVCGALGHDSKYCDETWRRFHNTTTIPEPERNGSFSK